MASKRSRYGRRKAPKISAGISSRRAIDEAREQSFLLSAFARNAQQPTAKFTRHYEEIAAFCFDRKIFSPDNFTLGMFSCAVLDSLPGAVGNWPRQMAETLRQRSEELNLPYTRRREMRRVAQAALWFDWPRTHLVPQENTLTGHHEKNMRDLFHWAGFPPDKTPHTIADLAHKVDLSFTGIKTPLLLELDGPHHFILDEEDKIISYNGNTWFQTALITKLAAQAILMRLPFAVSDVILNQPHERQAEFAEIVRQAAAEIPSGAYDIRLDRNHDFVIAPLRPDFP